MSLTQKRHGCLISFHAQLLSGEDMANVQQTAIKREHLHQLNNYQRLKQDSIPESKCALTGYFQYFTDPDIHSLQAQRTVAKAKAVWMTPHCQEIKVHIPVFHEIFNTTRNFSNKICTALSGQHLRHVQLFLYEEEYFRKFIQFAFSFMRRWGLTFRHRASCILGQAFHYSPENAFYVFNQQIYFII